MPVGIPRVLVAGLRGGSGKTLISLGLAAAWRKQDLVVAPYKKGPDYIDAAWLTLAAGRPCRNLDLFFFPSSVLLASFRDGFSGADVAVIEGNRGLFDGMDAQGSFSSAELAKLLRAPVLLSIDATKTTRTAAAMILGCKALDPDVPVAGVILNRCAGPRHETVLREAVEAESGVPVLGAIPRLEEELFPERHLGLVPPQETDEVSDPLARVAEVAKEYLDLERILSLAESAEGLEEPGSAPPRVAARARIEVGREGVTHRIEAELDLPRRPRIGVFRDAAFQFYYPENLEALETAGGDLVEISPLQDPQLPEVDALYLGGGFPETLALGLSENRSFARSVREAAEGGLPIYAECGGAVYLGERLHYEERLFTMAGVLLIEFGFQSKPRGHGYTIVDTVGENPFFPVGETLRGHEFHYTYMLSQDASELDFAFRMRKGYGFDGEWDGLCRHQVLAAYTHLHALGTELWAPALVRAAERYLSR